MEAPAMPIEPLDAVLGPNGTIATNLPGFESRPGQLQMAKLIERGILEGMHTIVEAGTGVGKSLAYLVPAIRSGKKIVISTGTIALQEQLVRKDIPLVLGALGTEARVELLKGRSNYLCREKLDRLRAERLVASTATMQELWEWGDATSTGDRAEIAFAPPGDEWEALDADADDCVGEACAQFRRCHYFARRDAVRSADIVIVNHALFFLDVVTAGGILPPYDVAILDEAHQCERYATAAFTASISPRGVGRMLRRLERWYALPARYRTEIDGAMHGLGRALTRIPGERYPLAANDDAPGALGELHGRLAALENWVHGNWESGLRRPSESEAEAERRRELALRAITAHIGTIERTELPDDEAISWVERPEAESAAGRYEINVAPFDVAHHLRAMLFARTPSVVLTSATIADGPSGATSGPFARPPSFTFLRGQLGIDRAEEAVAPSPFDFSAQARLYVAPAWCNPKDSDFAEYAVPIVEELLDRSRGRAFVLFTSYARMREMYGRLHGRIPYPVRMQGTESRAHTLAWFHTKPNAVLFATSSFWEGIDVVGDRLSCVIVDRIPFPSPSDPIVAARCAAIERSGRSSFDEYMIPAAIARLRQGFGRLIRSRADRGVLALLDGRVRGMRYGRTILDAMPPATRIEHLDAIGDFFG